MKKEKEKGVKKYGFCNGMDQGAGFVGNKSIWKI